ncbi:TIGR03619 family F420-dependent LLM class oxidoreductase [Labrenzia sp. DG1229]|uniref:TIGR03619 family F420-dependent LLM class oxidoreductase n=1 Tax=Labrenzia sp. DG1229 TaxID=681847 RepID=UPI00155D92D9|nr:TIGR03619 family F420-dependent LLM class oxidoreductase [Labrenzia sp. DG1229]
MNLINNGPGISRESISRWAETIEGLGFDMLLLSDHVAITSDVNARYPAPFFDPITTLAFVAARTRTIALGTTALILPLRHVLEMAKSIGTIDELSGGRFEAIGVCVGWSEPEYEALGIPFSERGRISDDYLEALRKFWASDVASHHGVYARFSDVYTTPRPERTPQIWVAGLADPVLRRAVRLGDTWHPINRSVAWMTDAYGRLQTIAAEENKPVPTFAPRLYLRITDSPLGEDHVAGEGTPEQIQRDIAALRDVGAEYFIFDPHAPDARDATREPDLIRLVERVAEEIIDLTQGTIRS